MCFYYKAKKMQCAKQDVSSFTQILKEVSQEKRLQILCMLSKEKSLCVCQIIERLWISQNLVSHHLKILKKIWFLNTKRVGKNIHYSINQKKFDEFKKTLKNIFNI